MDCQLVGLSLNSAAEKNSSTMDCRGFKSQLLLNITPELNRCKHACPTGGRTVERWLELKFPSSFPQQLVKSNEEASKNFM